MPIHARETGFSEINVSVITLPPANLQVAVSTWYARNTRSWWGSFDVMFGAAVGSRGANGQGTILVSA
jgi:hypothetical protein